MYQETLQCISYHYHTRVQQCEVQIMDIWIAGIILWHLCVGQTGLTRTLQLKETPLNPCVTIPDNTGAASSTANHAPNCSPRSPPPTHTHPPSAEGLLPKPMQAFSWQRRVLLPNLWQIYTRHWRAAANQPCWSWASDTLTALSDTADIVLLRPQHTAYTAGSSICIWYLPSVLQFYISLCHIFIQYILCIFMQQTGVLDYFLNLLNCGCPFPGDIFNFLYFKSCKEEFTILASSF